MGRELQKHHGQKPQIVMTMPLLEGLDGQNKMSKSLGNYIGIDEPAKDVFGKVMSISDELMWRYYQLLSNKSSAQIEELKVGHPRHAKVELAKELWQDFITNKQLSKLKKILMRAFEIIYNPKILKSLV